MLTENELYSEYQDNYRYAHDFWSSFHENAAIHVQAAAGLTWTDKEIKKLLKEGREPLELNIMRRPLQFFSGYLRDNLNSIVYEPVEGSDEATSSQFSKISYYIWDKGSGYSTLLDYSDECMKAGISLCGIQVDYSKDPINGDLGFYGRTFNSFYLDPTFERVDLKDCGFAITRDLIGRTRAKSLLPFVDPKLIDEVQRSFRDDKFMSYHPNFTTLSRNQNILAYDQYYRRITKRRKLLIDERAGTHRDITDLGKEAIEKLRFGIGRIRKLRDEAESLNLDESQLPPVVEIREVERDFVELNIMLNGQPVYTGEDKTGIVQTYPFVPLICYMEPSIWQPSLRFQGIPAALYSCQRQFNKRHMKIIDMMDSDISKGYKYLIGSVPDVSDLQQTGQNKIIGVDPQHAPEGLNSVQQLQGGQADASIIQYQQVLDQLTLVLANVNESVLGVDDKGNTEISGKLAQVRIAQGLRSNRKVIDNIETAQRVLGEILLPAIQKHYTPGKVRRILNEEPSEQFYSADFEQYDAVVKESLRSQSQKDAYYYELVNLKREGIVNVPEAEIIRALQTAGKGDLQKAIEEQSKVAEVQQQKIDAQEDVALRLGNARVEQDLALAAERRARVQADIGLAQERISEASQNRAQAALDRAKTITEIAGMRDDRIMQVLQFVNMLERQEREDQDKVQAQNIVESEQTQDSQATQPQVSQQQMPEMQQAPEQTEQSQNPIG